MNAKDSARRSDRRITIFLLPIIAGAIFLSFNRELVVAPLSKLVGQSDTGLIFFFFVTYTLFAYAANFTLNLYMKTKEEKKFSDKPLKILSIGYMTIMGLIVFTFSRGRGSGGQRTQERIELLFSDYGMYYGGEIATSSSLIFFFALILTALIKIPLVAVIPEKWVDRILPLLVFGPAFALMLNHYAG